MNTIYGSFRASPTTFVYGFLAAWLIAFCSTLNAAGPASSQEAGDAERQAMRALIPIYEDAVNSRNIALLEPYLDSEFSGVMVTNEGVTDFKSVLAYWEQMQKTIGPQGTYRVKVSLAERSKLSADMAVAHGTSEDQVATASGTTMDFQSNWTAVLRKRDGQWKLLRLHSSMNPVSNPFVASVVRGNSILWGCVGAAAGVVVGWLLSRMVGRGARKSDAPS